MTVTLVPERVAAAEVNDVVQVPAVTAPRSALSAGSPAAPAYDTDIAPEAFSGTAML